FQVNFGWNVIAPLCDKWIKLMRFSSVVVFSLLYIVVAGQPKTDSLLYSILAANHDQPFQQVLSDPQTYRLQIIYTEIDRNRHNKLSFRNYYFNYDPDLYFNPASTVKLPLGFLSLEKLNAIHGKGVTKYTAMQFDSSFEKQVKLYRDTSSPNSF